MDNPLPNGFSFAGKHQL